MILHLDQQVCPFLNAHFIKPEKVRPFRLDSLCDEMSIIDYSRIDSLRLLYSIVNRKQRNGKNILNRALAISGSAVDPLETQITACHHQAAPSQHILLDYLQPIRHAFAFQERLRW